MAKLSLEKLRKDISSYLEEAGAVALIGISPENVFYSSRANIHTMHSMRLRCGIVLFPIADKPVLIVQKHEARYSRKQSWIEDIRIYPGLEGEYSPMSDLAEAMRDRNIVKGKVLIDKSYFCLSYFEELQRAFPNIVFDDGTHIFRRLRMVKHDEEIELLQKGAIATEKAIVDAYSTAKPNDYEKSVSDNIISNLLKNGADLQASMTWACGREMTLMNHTKAGTKKILPGDIIRVDVGGWFKGYRSDLVRMAVVGKPSDKQKRIYNDLIEIHLKLRESLTVGTRCCDVFSYAESLFKKAGYEVPLSLVGHSIGTEVHEFPLLSKSEEEVIQPNMLFYVEPMLAVEDVGGFHIEDLMMVTEKGPKLLSTATPINEMYIIE